MRRLVAVEVKAFGDTLNHHRMPFDPPLADARSHWDHCYVQVNRGQAHLGFVAVKVAVADAGGVLGKVVVDAVVVAESGSGSGETVLEHDPAVPVCDFAAPVRTGFEMFAGAFDPGSVGHQEVAVVDVDL